MPIFKEKRFRDKLPWVLVVVIFLLDVSLSHQFNLASNYLLAIFIGIYSRQKNDVVLLAILSTVLTLIGAIFQPRTPSLDEVLLGRVTIILSFWPAAYFVIRFITLRQDEEQLAEKLKALFMHAGNGILLTDQQGRILTANPAAELLFGYGSGEMTGKPVEVLIPTRYAKRHLLYRENFNADPTIRAMDRLNLYGLRRDGSEFPVEVSLSPFQTNHGQFTVAFITDITHRKTYEESILSQQEELTNLTSQLRELNETLEHKVGERTEELEQAKNHLAQALNKERDLGELKSRFVSMASHEFRTPLSAVLSSASLITSYADRNDIANVKKHSDRIKNSVNGLNTILTEFLSLGKLEEGHIRPKMEPVNLPGAVRDVVTEMKNLFKTGQTFLHSHEGGDEIRIDPGLLKNILINLISNAIKYSPDQGRIMVETTVENGTARLSVRDQGIGIPDDEQRHLFDRFFRATNATNIHGTGLGLYIVRRYVEMLDGQIGFNSQIHKGSEFWVEFPVEPHDESQPPA